MAKVYPEKVSATFRRFIGDDGKVHLVRNNTKIYFGRSETERLIGVTH